VTKEIVSFVTLLDEIFGERDAITFMMSQSRQEELSGLIAKAMAIEAIAKLDPDQRCKRIHFDWLDAGEVAQREVARPSEQPRRYIDDLAFLENPRIMQILRGIEADALAVREIPPSGTFVVIDKAAPAVLWRLRRSRRASLYSSSATRSTCSRA